MADTNAAEGTPSRPLARVTSLVWGLVIAIILAFAFFASSLCITLVLAAFLAILIDPVVIWLERAFLPRPISAALVILLGVLVLGLLGYASYDKATAFVDELPQYTGKIRQIIRPITQK